MKYYYVHGLMATGQNTANELKRVLGVDVEVLSWDYTKTFEENFKNMSNVLDNEEDDFILIGCSMGGYYANALANKYQCPCSLINPAISPKDTLSLIKSNAYKTNNAMNYYREGIEKLTDDVINSYKDSTYTRIPRVVIVGTRDEVVNPQSNIDYWKDRCELIIVNEPHKISNLEQFKKPILELENLFFFDF